MGSESCREVRPLCFTCGGLALMSLHSPRLLLGLLFAGEPGCGVLRVVKGAEEGSGGCLNLGVQSR